MWFNQFKWIFLSIHSVTFRMNGGNLDKCKLGCMQVFEAYLSSRLTLFPGGVCLGIEFKVCLWIEFQVCLWIAFKVLLDSAQAVAT